ncbi:MAG: hypothetical protein HC915_10880 [Anaerolineae bacterium]|nr:hypothetical protein [Anaerolineae bacterium]
MLHGLQQLGFGQTPFALRYGSVLIHLLTMAVGMRVACRWYGLGAGALAGTLLALSPLLWEYAQEVRAYVVVPLFALLLLGGAEAILQPRARIPWRTWAGVLAIELAALYTHNLAVPLVAWLNLVIISALGWQTWRRRGPAQRRLLAWLAAQTTLFLLYLPWLLTQSRSGTSLNSVPQPSWALVQDIWQAYFFPVTAERLPGELRLTLGVLAILVGFSLVLNSLRDRSLKRALITSQALLLPALSTALLIAASIDFHPRYFVAGVPATLLLLVTAERHRLPNFVVLSLGTVIFLQSTALIQREPAYQHDDFRAVATYYASLPPEARIIIPYGDEPAFSAYYAAQLGIQAQFVELPLHSSPAAAIRRLNSALLPGQPTHFELLTWFQLPADDRLMLGCLLAGAGHPTNFFGAYGLSSRAYTLSQPIEPHPLPIAARFEGPLGLEGAWLVEGGASPCLHTAWQLDAPAPDPSFRLAVQVETPVPGWALLRQDATLRRDDQAEVGDWAPGDQGSAFASLAPPPGTPPGDYAWALSLYSLPQVAWTDGRAARPWAVLDAEGRFAGHQLALPQLALPGSPDLALDQVYITRFSDLRTDQDSFPGGGLEPTITPRSLPRPTPALEVRQPAQPTPAELRLVGADFVLRHPLPDWAGYAWATFPLPLSGQGAVEVWWGQQPMLQYTLLPTDRLFSAPAIEQATAAHFPNVGHLLGANQVPEAVEVGTPFAVEVVWQAEPAPDLRVDYVVFVQLLTPDGRLLAQSDAPPAAGTRPASGWLPHEFILDLHTLDWKALDYRGERP